jgi:hypothetical protein
MTLNLTTAIAVQNVPKLRVMDAYIDDNGVAIVRVEARGVGAPGKLYGNYVLSIVNGDGTPATASTGLQLAAVSVTYQDAIRLAPQLQIPSGATHIGDVLDGSGSRAVKMRAVETLGITDGWLVQPGFAGTVS